jgi:prepilin-type N-terminal cleavage/methylation domain-containing protein
MISTCLNSILIKISILIEGSGRLDVFSRHKGFSLPEVMISLLLVSLGASALISNMAASRMQEANTARFSTAFRLAFELSDWVRQGGLSVFASGVQNPLELVEAAGSVPVCFSASCDAKAAALFYLQNWRRRLLLKVPNARMVICNDSNLISPASPQWSCDSHDSSFKTRVIKIGWPQGRDGKEFPPRLVLALG